MWLSDFVNHSYDYKQFIIGWGFCDIQNNQSQGRGYQLKIHCTLLANQKRDSELNVQ